MRTTDLLPDLAQDLRYGWRQLRSAPRFTLAVVLVLALGIGANIAIFSIIDAALIRPLPFPRPEQWVHVRGADELPAAFSVGRPKFGPNIDDFRADTATYASVGAYATGGLNFGGGAEPVRATVTYVTAGFFQTLGRAPMLGRLPAPAAYEAGGPKSIVISRRTWEHSFGGDRGVIGRPVTLNGVVYQVSGVMPDDFGFPAQTEIWIPLPLPFATSVFDAFRNFIPSKSIARLAPGVSIAQAAARADAVRKRYKPASTGGMQIRGDDTPIAELVQPLQKTLIGDRRTALLVLMGSAALLLIIACANVTNLLLSRAAARQREIAVRAVLGATRWRIVRQLAAESVLLALAGAVAALVVAHFLVAAVGAALPPGLADVAPPRLDARVLAFTLLVACLTSIACGVLPAFGVSRPNLGETMKAAGAGGGGSRRRGIAARGALVVAEVSLALMLLIGAGLMIESLRSLLSNDTGMNVEQVATARLVLARAKYPDAPTRAELLRRIVERLRAMPGVSGAASVSALPMEGAGGIALRVRPIDAPESSERAGFGQMLKASPGYFALLGVPLRGEDLPAAADSARPVVVINQTLAATLWPGQDAIGRQIKDLGPRTVIGVVGDVRTRGMDEAPTGQIYLPMAEQPEMYAAIVVRGALPTAALLADIRRATRAVDAAQPLYAMRAMEDVIGASVAPRRTNTMLLAAFGAVAVLLASIGVYAVLSYGVAQRTREIGVRVALGAQRRDVVGLVAWQGATLAAIGIAIGLAGAYALSKYLSSILYQVSPRDPRVFLAAPVVLAAVALAATLFPALRATRVDPVTALRDE
jgi:putative ABC transport system permease protein